jgi:hypothetical protein
MKLISTIGFLIAFGLSVKVANLQQRRVIQTITSRNTGVVGYGLAMLSMLLVFVQYWCLTRIFPVYIILSLIVASSLGPVIHNVLGAIAGFGTQQKQSRINILAVTYAAQHRVAGRFLLIGGVVIVLGALIEALYKFWRLPIGSNEAVAWIAFCLFIILGFFSLVMLLLSTLPTIASEYTDDDVRSYLLSSAFSSVIYSTVALIFPVWIFNNFSSTLNQWMPAGWVILSIPSLIFLVSFLPSYFMGARRYRTQLKTQMEWRKEWLKETGELLTLPEPGRTASIQVKNAQLNAKITEATEANELRKFIDDLEGIAAAIQTNPNPVFGVLRLIYENRGKLENWDVRYCEIDRLRQLSIRVSETSPGDLAPYITSARTNLTDDIAAVSRQKSVIAGGIWTLLTFLGPIVLKAYQEPIFSFVGRRFWHS